MRGLLALALAAAFPVMALLLLMLLSHLEDTLSRDIRSARRIPDPPPILRIPVRSAAAHAPPPVPILACPRPAAVGAPPQPSRSAEEPVGDLVAGIPRQRRPDETVPAPALRAARRASRTADEHS
ncbi:MAG: hypothetical protein ACXVXG_04535 [Nocardioidaceae bacterium]